ncbi:4'-phosphopantetheinyl transferase superfamily protein [Herbidospora galbida]|uniref:4'-phosphopantetheinyl transferase superfamily protein n=1 Tax=Herbidospora galbida TaxID=2575442 RepID=A0A4U3M562_9ACTN|nr:4'-phosphopantetheinyl transferase superfamily protein [Herbidospora galbida]TKK84005.1 4'-phosphopantetheinyl transferase superfamily protein [Herbidospora galbida]
MTAVLIGVDIVSADRLSRAAARGGATFARHLTTLAERDRGLGAATFPVKESFIKAVGGRPPGFSWHDFEAAPEPPSPWAGELLDEAAAELTAATGLALTAGAAYVLRGACREAARLRLAGGRGQVAGAARWGSGAGLLVSLAVVYADRKDTRCP